MLGTAELKTLLDARLVQLAFNTDSATAIKAIEMLKMGGGHSAPPAFINIPTDVLLEMQSIVEKRLLATAASLASTDRPAVD